MKKFIILILLLVSSVYPQSVDYHLDFLFTDLIYIPNDSTELTLLAYRIPYNSLVFEKEGELFKAEFRLSIEVFDSLQSVTREIVEDKIVTQDYTETESKEIFKEGMVNLRLSKGNYKILSVFTDLNANNEIKLKTRDFKINLESVFYQPLIIREVSCQELNIYLENYNGDFPFDGNDREIIIPVSNNEEKLNLEIFNNGEIVKQELIEDQIQQDISAVMCNGKIFFRTTKSDKFSFIKIKLGTDLVEGDLQINILNSKREKLFTFDKTVRWFNKPRTLQNKETAVSLLKIIDKDEAVDLLDKDDPDLSLDLLNYWKKYDPTPGTSFNELMNEFYKRADYAEENFRSFTGKSGLESDRAKIYIQFGKPLSVDRFSNQKGKIIEIWYYTENKKFSFIDEKGTGEFSLLNS